MLRMEERSHEVLDLLKELVRHPSTNGSENCVSDFLMEYFTKMGLEARQQESVGGLKNVIAVADLGEGGKTVLLNSHMDVVDPGNGWDTDPFELVIKGSRAYGRGSTDAKGALACLIVAVQNILRDKQDLKGRIIVTAVVDEEKNSYGARTLCENGISADYAIVGEPTWSKIGICHNGSIRPVIRIQGRSAHSAAPSLGISAIRVAAFISAQVDQIAEEISGVCHPLNGSPSISITKIHGGTKENMIPDTCELTIDRRMVPGESEADIIARFEKLCADTEAAFPGSKVVIDHYIVTTGPASEVAEDSDIVQMAQAARTEVLGETDAPIGLICNTDMNHFIRCGIPTVIIGPGTIEIAHMPNEFVDIEELGRASCVQEAVIRSFLSRG